MILPHKPYDLHGSVGYQATLSSRVYERRLEDSLKTIGLTRLHWCMLVAIGLEARRTPSDISQFLGIARTATSRALRGMERDGLIERNRDHGDRRKTEVSLSDLGQEKLAQALPLGLENNAHFTQKLTAAEAAVLNKLLIKLRRNEANELSNF